MPDPNKAEVVTFKFEKETPNTIRYEEDSPAPMFGKVYLQKWAYVQLGSPQEITLTLSVPQGGSPSPS